MSNESAVAASVTVAALSKVFKPSAPTDDPELFRGRGHELAALASAMQEEGQHAIVFGERGVGKTSLAYMGAAVFQEATPGGLSVRLPCGADDGFGSVWAKLVSRLQAAIDTQDDSYRDLLGGVVDRIEDMFLDPVTPEVVSRALNLLSSRVGILIVVDEFDRINGYEHSAAFADLIKQLSDDLVPCTICLVGVADDVSGLIAGHASIDRSLRQVFMPRMTQEELSAIVEKGSAVFSDRSGYALDIEPSAVSSIARLSQGFPYYTHLLASMVGKKAILDASHSIHRSDVFAALVDAQQAAEPSIKDVYYRATLAARSDATFEETLLACALAKVDVKGYFAASDVRSPLERLLNMPRRNSDFNAHLRRFSEQPPYVLESDATTRAVRYRFANPLMKPYVFMRGISSGRLTNLDDLA